MGGRLENIVYNELLSRGYTVYIGKTYNSEVDFVADDGNNKKYIQVTDFLASDEVLSREFGAFDSINDNFEKIVLSMDKMDCSGRRWGWRGFLFGRIGGIFRLCFGGFLFRILGVG